MIQSKILCDVCGQEVEHVTELRMLNTFHRKEYHIQYLCEGCVDAIESALDRRQHLNGCKVQPYEKGLTDAYHIDTKGNKILHKQTR